MANNKKRNNYKGKSNGKQSTYQERKDPRSGEGDRYVGKTHNDPSWYVENPQMLKDIASLPFAQVAGLPVNFSRISNIVEGQYANVIPGVCELRLVPSLGCGESAIDAPTIAARRIYNWVRHANSGSANYEAPDLFMMIAARMSASAWLTSLKRVYGLAFNYYSLNRYYADTVIRACGFEPGVITQHLNELRTHINLSCARLNTIKIPAGMPILERWNWLNSNIFADDDSIKAQVYVPRFMHYFEYSATADTRGTSLLRAYPHVSEAGNPITVSSLDQIYSFTERLLNPLLSDEDIGIMSGDIIKAYGQSVVTETLIADNFTTLPTYDHNVMAQIHNAICAPGSNDGSGSAHYVYQEDGIVKERYAFNSSQIGKDLLVTNGRYMMDLYTDSATPEVTIVATRLIPTFGEPVPESSYNCAVKSCGSEIPVGFRIHIPGAAQATSNIIDLTDGNTSQVEFVTAMSSFNWHPMVYVFTTDGSTHTLRGWLGDLENYCVVDADVILRMHKNAILAEFRTNEGAKYT